MGKTVTKGRKKKKQQKGKKRNWIKIAFKTTLWLSFIGIVLGCAFFLYVYLGIPAPLPKPEALATIDNPEASLIYDASGKEFGKYYIYDRTTTDIDKVSKYVIQALVATEDVRFYEHNGIDFRSLARVLIRTLIMGDESGGGGSTITQQLAKNLYPRQQFPFASMAVNKVREMIIAYRMEQIFSKEQIMQLYLNTVPFSSNVYGIEAASRKYFSKPASQLKANEAAALVGTLKASSYYHPYHHPERAEERRDVVLHQMLRAGFITGQEEEHLIAEPLMITYKGRDRNATGAYFLDRLKLQVKKRLEEKGREDLNLYTSGLKIYTTLDKDLQKKAEYAVTKHLTKLQKQFDQDWSGRDPFSENSSLYKNAIRNSPQYKSWKAAGKSQSEIKQLLKKKRNMRVYYPSGEKEVNFSVEDSVKHYLTVLHTGFLAMDPKTGEIKAWVGGVDHSYFKYDHVNRGTKRQVGSTFKPFVYATALEQEISPCRYFDASQQAYADEDGEWKPANSDGNYEGKYSLEGALTNSVNTVSVKVLEATGLENVIETTYRLGVETKLDPYPSIALGTPSISLMEMVTSYSTFVNDGVYQRPVFLTRIEDKEGNTIWELEDKDSKRAIKPETAHMMVEMLKGVVDKGTARRLRATYNLPNEIAGKTGTTQNNADGWFMGMTPRLVVGTWVGADNPSVHFRTTGLGQGANTALPIFAEFMKQVNADARYRYISNAKFKPLTQLEKDLVSCDPFREEIKLWDFLKGLAKGKNKKKKGRRGEDEVVEDTDKPNEPAEAEPKKDKKKKKGIFKRLFGKKDE